MAAKKALGSGNGMSKKVPVYFSLFFFIILLDKIKIRMYGKKSTQSLREAELCFHYQNSSCTSHFGGEGVRLKTRI
jgi:hypothetical protein